MNVAEIMTRDVQVIGPQETLQLAAFGKRARAEAALGAKFDVRKFHDALLVEGPLPLDLLDARMDAWIVGQDGR